MTVCVLPAKLVSNRSYYVDYSMHIGWWFSACYTPPTLLGLRVRLSKTLRWAAVHRCPPPEMLDARC